VLITRWQILRANPLDKIENSLSFKYTIAPGRIAIVNHVLSNDESGTVLGEKTSSPPQNAGRSGFCSISADLRQKIARIALDFRL
jgi:hypothetical protein